LKALVRFGFAGFFVSVFFICKKNHNGPIMVKYSIPKLDMGGVGGSFANLKGQTSRAGKWIANH